MARVPRLPRSGTIAEHPFVCYGTGPRLVVIPGVNDPLLPAGERRWVDGVLAGYCYRQAKACAAAGAPRTVYYVSRPVDTSARTITAMADGYRAVLDTLGRADVLGISMGGFVSLALARTDGRVRSLVLGLAAARLSRHGRESVTTWSEWAGAGAWRRLYATGLDTVTSGWRRRVATATIPLLVHGRDTPTNRFRRSLTAAAAFDATPWLGELSVPALVVGGTADPFFTATAFARTADALGCRYKRLDDWGHDVLVDAGELVDEPVSSFLAGDRDR